MKQIKSCAVALTIQAALIAGGNHLYAAAQLSLSDGSTTIIVVDGGPGDASTNAGVITFIGAVGPDWFFNATAGVTKPAVGSPASPYMDVGTTSLSSQAGQLTIEFTDTDFTASGTGTASVGATVPPGGTISYNTWLDAGNNPFAKTTPLTTIGPIGGAPSGTATADVGVGPYSLTLQTIINHTGAGQTHVDAEFRVIPSRSCDCELTLTPPADLSLCGEANLPDGNQVAAGLTVTDSCGVIAQVQFLGDEIVSGSCPKIIKRTFAAIDSCRNLRTAIQTITVKDPAAPVFTQCPPDLNLGCNPASIPDCNLADVAATNTCGTTPTITCAKVDTANGCVYTRTITYTATNDCGNSATCVQKITWTVDTTPPVFTQCPTDRDLGCNPASIPDCDLTQVAATDDCGTPVITCASVDGTSGCLSTRTITYTATDACGNRSTCIQKITWTLDTTFSDYLIIGMRPKSNGEAVTIGSSQEIGADRQTLSGDNPSSDPYVSPVTPNISPAYPAPFSPDLRDVLFKDPSAPTNPSKNRWLWDAGAQMHYLPGAAPLFRGVDWSGNVAVTSPSGTFSLQDINVFGTFGFRSRSTTAPVNVSNSRYFAAPSLTGVLMDPIEGGGASQPARGWIGGYDHDPLLAKLRALRTFIRGLPKDADFNSGNSSNPRDLVNRNTINAGGAVTGPNTKLVYDLDALDVNGDGYAVIDIPNDGTDFEINNSDWIITDSNLANGTPFAIFRLRGGANMNMSQSSIMAGAGFVPTYSGLVAAFVKVHPEEEFFSNSGSSDSVFTANNLVINRIGFWDFNTIGDASTDTDYGGFVDRNAQNNYTILSVNNGQGCGQFISGQVYMQNVRWVRCTECVCVEGAQPNSAGASAIPAGGLPSGWSTKDIGAVSATGDANHTGGKFTVVGSGADIWGTGDEFRYVYQTSSGDCSIVAKVLTVDNTNPWAKAGVMIRESLTAGSRHASVFLTPGNGVAFQSRSGPSGSSAHPSVAGTAPRWVKIVRTGSTFKGYCSSDGATWTLVGSQTITVASNVYIGLAVTSHNDGILCTATFDSVTASP